MRITDNGRRRVGQAILAVLLGVTAGLFISGYWLIDVFPAGSHMLSALTALVCAVAAAGYYVGIEHLDSAAWHATRRSWLKCMLLGAPVAAFLLFAGTSQWQKPSRYLGFWLPEQRFSLVAINAEPGVAITWINTSLGDVSYASLMTNGWLRQGERMILQDAVHNSIEWHGMTGDRMEIVFQDEEPGGEFRIDWGDADEVIHVGAGKSNYQKTFTIPFFASRNFILVLGMLQFWVLATAGILMAWRLPGARGAGTHAFGADSWRWPDVAMEILLLVALMALAALLRSFNLGAMFPAVDEYYHLIAADQLLRGAPLDSVYSRGLWVVTLPVAFALRLLGHEVWAARAAGVVFNVLALAPLYALSRKVSRAAAVAIGILYACSPWIITFARVAREYAYYPLYFYVIVWLMIELVELVPPGFIAARDWRRLMRPRVALLALALLIPPFFALRIDWLSTFRTILIAYLVLGVFLLGRFDWRASANGPTLGVLVTALVAVGGYFYREQLTKLLLVPRVNPVPLSYFFPNPAQQWYFDRLGLIAGIAVIAAAAGATLHRRHGVVPLFMVSLFAAYLLVFALFSRSFFHTRHLLSTQLWFLVVVGIGLAWIWEWLRGQFVGHRTATGIVIAVMLGVLVLNPAQILLPTLSQNPDMPISEDYLHDMSAVQEYLLHHAQQGDALVSTVYGLYATWEQEPAFGSQLRINSGTSRDEIAAFVQGQESGWIVIDSIRLDQSTLSERSITGLPRMEYIGYFGDEHVWRWGHARELSSANAF